MSGDQNAGQNLNTMTSSKSVGNNKTLSPKITLHYILFVGHALAQLVEALRYKLEGRGFDSPMVSLEFFIDNPSSRTMALGLTQPLTEMSSGIFPVGVKAAGA